MRKIYLSILFAACAVVSTVRSELLIVKKEGEIFVPLSEQDIAQRGDRLQEIMLKYQWPMVIASDLTEQEQEELLSSGAPHAEERFIEKKIQEVSPKYGVVFIPTTLYELFCINHYFFQSIEEKNLLREAVNGFLIKEQELKSKAWVAPDNENVFRPDNDQLEVDLGPLLREPKENYQQTMKAIYDLYKKVNAFFNRRNSSVYFYVNNVLVQALFGQYPELSHTRDSSSFSNVIKNKPNDFTSFLIGKLLDDRERLSLPGLNSDYISYFSDSLKTESNRELVDSFIALEYEARELNKALLLRGTSFGKKQIGLEQEEELAGFAFKIDKPLQEIYGKKLIEPYSVSFGNSPFAGIFGDKLACAYNFLIGTSQFGGIYDTTAVAQGYAVLINKKNYFNTRVSRLFFIPPLSTLAGLTQIGEFFHPRTTLAVLLKLREVFFEGLTEVLDDPMGVLLITRDPLKQAELFSQFLADGDNIRMIKNGRVLNYSEEGREVVRRVLAAQAKAARFYHDARIAFPLVQRWAWRQVAATEKKELSKDAPDKVADFEKAQRGMDDPNNQVRKEALALFRKLVDDGYAYRTATVAARRGIVDLDAQVRIEVISLLRVLTRKRLFSNDEDRDMLRRLKYHDPDPEVKRQARSIYLW